MRLSDEQLEGHVEACRKLHAIKDDAFRHVRDSLVDDGVVTEQDVRELILRRMVEEGLVTDGDEPIVAVNAHAATPHYFTMPRTDVAIKRGDLILIDLWARHPGGIYADISWMAYAGKDVPEDHAARFALIRRARDEALRFMKDEISRGHWPLGRDVDKAARDVIAEAGYDGCFVHNLGHSIDTEVHGSSTNLNGYSKTDDRRVHERLLFSVEPGIYLEGEAGYRTEIDAYIKDCEVVVTGPVQQAIVPLLDKNSNI